jgi:hypothetical protein
MQASTSLLASLTLALAAIGSAQASPTTVFADNFEDGNVSDWTVSASAGVSAPVVTVRSDSVHGGSFAMQTYFDAPGGGFGANHVWATHSFDVLVAGDHLLELWARSAPCGGCTMHFDVLVDGVQLARDGSAQNDYDFRSYALDDLAAGTHTLTLGMFTDGASSGRFQASFDDVRISTEAVASVPEPGTLALAAAGLLLVGLRRRA